jgi:hypothetical protein
MKDWRAKQPKRPRAPKGRKTSMGVIQIEDVKPDAPALVAYKSRYDVIHKRILTLKECERFIATVESDGQAQWARTSALNFAWRNKIVISTTVVNKQIEIKRLPDATERVK